MYLDRKDLEEGGRCLLLAAPSILDGELGKLAPITMLEYHSGRIKRVVRSTLAAEAYTLSEGVEGAEYVRFVLAEMFAKNWYESIDRIAAGLGVEVSLDPAATSARPSTRSVGLRRAARRRTPGRSS